MGREAELQEKLRKEEEERLARKKRIEEIMARTRGKGGANTPKKEVKEESVTSQSEQPASLDTNVDPTKPDLLGDISDKVEAKMPRTWQTVPRLLPPSPLFPLPLRKLSLKREPWTPSVIKVKKMKIPARLLPLKMAKNQLRNPMG